MAVSLSSKTVKLYSPVTGQFIGECCKGQHSDSINHILFSDNLLHSFSSDGTLRAWVTRSYQQVSCLNAGPSQEIFSFLFGGSGDNLLAAGCKSQILFWDWRNKKQVACLEESHMDDVTQVHFVPNQHKLISASIDGLICTFDTSGEINDDDHLESVEKLGKDSLINFVKTSMSSRLLLSDSDFSANLVVEAVQSVKMTNVAGQIKYPIKGINILNAHGKRAKESYLLKGYAINSGRAAQGMPMKVCPARIACIDFNLQKTKMQSGVQVLVTDPRELEKIRQRQADVTKEWIQKLLKAGANVVLTTKGIDDMALKSECKCWCERR